MRKLWGPLGWLTLHSISALYPDEPTDDDKAKLKEFMNLFKFTIVCPNCKGHFREMFDLYTRLHPEWLNSKFDLFVFICRAHNTVNKRLDKPIIRTIDDCITTLKNNTLTTSSMEYRKKYVDYITNSWTRDRSDSTIVELLSCTKLRKIIDDYWNKLPQEINFSYSSDVDVQEYIGKITPSDMPPGYLNNNLKILNRNPKPVKEYTTYTPQRSPSPVLYTHRKSKFILQNGKMRLVDI
jgi:hypothetical protein